MSRASTAWPRGLLLTSCFRLHGTPAATSAASAASRYRRVRPSTNWVWCGNRARRRAARAASTVISSRGVSVATGASGMGSMPAPSRVAGSTMEVMVRSTRRVFWAMTACARATAAGGLR